MTIPSFDPDTPVSPGGIGPLPLATAWPLLVAVLVIMVGAGLSGFSPLGTTSVAAVTILILMAMLTAGAGVIAAVRTPDAGPTFALTALAATVASLLALSPIDAPASAASLTQFLLVGPWHYLLVPIVVHFALAIGWPHRRRYWYGLVVGWYILHGAMWLATVLGIVAGEETLIAAVDGTFRLRLLEPAGMVVALAALGLALASPARRTAQRRATGWAIVAIVLGAVPTVAATWFPEIELRLDGVLTTIHLALPFLALFGLAAVLALPFANPVRRDLLAYGISQRLLEERNLDVALREVATALQDTFEAEGVAIRLVDPIAAASVGSLRSPLQGPLPPDTETVDDRRTLVAPIGRGGDPFGEVRLEAAHAGAFGRREREWLTAFLGPVGAALRARRREQLLRQRIETLARHLDAAADRVGATLAQLPIAPGDDGMGIPPTVDAREVLGQLSDGLAAVMRRGEEVESVATTARERARAATDEVARALDELQRLVSDLLRLGGHADAIGAQNLGAQSVAFRTTLLANNAALEATRAGSAGRTFGVLAEEIRRLADATAESSAAIEARTLALAADVAAIGAATERVRDLLGGAIQDAEAGEDAARRLGDVAGTLLGDTRSLRPALEEAATVAHRRSARDHHLTATMERFLDERGALARAMTQHRTALGRLEEDLRGAGGGTPVARRVGVLRTGVDEA